MRRPKRTTCRSTTITTPRPFSFGTPRSSRRSRRNASIGSNIRALFREGYRLLPEGRYEIDPFAQWLRRFAAAGLLQQARRKGTACTATHKDIAASLQTALEEIALHVTRHFAAGTGMKNLCLAGGVAHNCSLNGRILREGIFDRVFVQPASHDAGGALGAALSVRFDECREAKPNPMSHVHLGRHIGDDAAVERALARWRELIVTEPLDDVVSVTADLLANGAVVGWVQGRSEFGPRALGNRASSVTRGRYPTAIESTR